jgi:hypothetical protein
LTYAGARMRNFRFPTSALTFTTVNTAAFERSRWRGGRSAWGPLERSGTMLLVL